jgi:hypothetical protein
MGHFGVAGVCSGGWGGWATFQVLWWGWDGRGNVRARRWRVSILNSNLDIVACGGNRSILSTYTQLHLTHEEKRVDEVKK